MKLGLDDLKCQVKRIRKVIQGKDPFFNRQSSSSPEEESVTPDNSKTGSSQSQDNNNNSHSHFYEELGNWNIEEEEDLIQETQRKMMAGRVPHASPSASSSSGGPQYSHHHSPNPPTSGGGGTVATLHSGGGGGCSTGGFGGGSSVEDTERLFMSESDVIHLFLEFLSSRGLTSSQVELERETGIVNEVIASPDLIFLRSLIVDGRWEDVTEFLQPLEEAFRTFPGKKVRATILKHRFLDILASYAGPGATMNAAGTFTTDDGKSGVVEDLVKTQ